jgi:nucleotide-binding universal stress UspA family protein
MKIMLAADGSEFTRAAAQYLATHLDFLAAKPTIEILHVRAPFPMPRAAKVVGKKAIESYEKEECEKALKVAESELKKAGVPFKSFWVVGDVADEIASYVKDNAVDLVVMGARGHGGLKGVAMGSVTTKVIAAIKTPILIAR